MKKRKPNTTHEIVPGECYLHEAGRFFTIEFQDQDGNWQILAGAQSHLCEAFEEELADFWEKHSELRSRALVEPGIFEDETNSTERRWAA